MVTKIVQILSKKVNTNCPKNPPKAKSGDISYKPFCIFYLVLMEYSGFFIVGSRINFIHENDIGRSLLDLNAMDRVQKPFQFYPLYEYIIGFSGTFCRHRSNCSLAWFRSKLFLWRDEHSAYRS